MLNLFWYEGFNNYYNRKLRYYDNINKYPSASYIQSDVINFNFGDGITTTQVVTWPSAAEFCADYLVITNEDNSINSRWFVIDADYKRKGQYVVSLKRDSIAEQKSGEHGGRCAEYLPDDGENARTLSGAKDQETILHPIGICC